MNLITDVTASVIFTLTGLRVQPNHLTFLVSLFASLLGSYIFKHAISRFSVNIQLVANGLFGLWLFYFNWGWSILFMIINAVGSYILLRTFPPSVAYKYTFIASMSLLSFCHFDRLLQFMTNTSVEYKADYTGPMMILTQRITSLSFSLHDGICRKETDLTEHQRKLAIRKMPSFVEYFGYMFNFYGMLAGPMVFYTDWMKCTELHSRETVAARSTSASSGMAVFAKVTFGLLMIAFFWIGSNTFPCLRNVDPEFISHTPLWYRVLFVYLSLLVARAKYYGVWLFADAVHNAGGIGFNGYDEKGRSKWDLVTNIHIFNIEFATGLKSYIDNWNITTTLWIRHVAYERLEPKYRTLGSFMLSAVWHGFFPGYYMMFLLCNIFVQVQRKVRRAIRPTFQNSASSRAFYEVLTFIVTQLAIAYLSLPFVLLEATGPMVFYKSVWFCGHIIACVLFFLLPQNQSPRSGDILPPHHGEKIANGKRVEVKESLLMPHATKQNGDSHVRHR